MQNHRIKRIIMIALFAALTCVATMVIRVPSPTGGYINPGDAAVLLSSFLLGPIGGAVAAALGSSFADIFSGYAIYAPATFIIKGLMGLACGAVYMRIKTQRRIIPSIISGVLAELIMIFGYLLFTAAILGLGAGALVEVPGNVVQGAFGLVAGTILNLALIKIPYIQNVASGFKQK